MLAVHHTIEITCGTEAEADEVESAMAAREPGESGTVTRAGLVVRVEYDATTTVEALGA